MGRTKTEGVAPVDLPELDGQKATEIQELGGALMSAHSEERDTLNQMIGQIQMTGAIAKLTTVVGLTKLAHIKETRMYKALSGKTGVDRNGDEIADVGTWEGFCLAIGTTRQKADEDILNLKTFGEEALEGLSRVGAGYRELRQFRKLPEDSRSALIEAAKIGNHEAVEYLAEELIAKHQKEKDELTKERDEAHADYDAQAEVLAKRAQELDETRQQLARAQKRIQSLPSNEAMKELRMEVSAAAYEAEALIMGKLRGAFELLNTESATSGEDSRDYMASLVKQLELQIIAIREDYNLPDDSSSEHDWMKPGAAEKAAESLGIESGH